MQIKLRAEFGHVPRGGIVFLCGQAGAVGVMRVRQPQLFGARVHQPHKTLFRPRKMLGKGDGRVIGAGDDHRFEQFAELVALPRVEKRLTAAHARRARRNRHLILQRHTPLIDRLQGEQNGHHLIDAGDRAALVRVLFKDDLSRRGLAENCAGAGQGNGCFRFHRQFVGLSDPRQQEQRGHQRRQSCFHLHGSPPLLRHQLRDFA